MLEDRLSGLERRIARIEAYLDLREEELKIEGDGEPARAEAAEVAPPAAPVVALPELSIDEKSVAAGASEAAPVREVHLPPPLPPMALVVEYRPVAEIAPKPRAAKVKRGSLEQTLGLKWTGWVGALVLLVGVGLGMKFVYDQHWFAAVPKVVWLSMIALGGFALIGLGEWAYRKVNVIPAASLFGVGIATLLLASYVGHAYYRIYSPGVAFGLMVVSTAVGAAVARRGNLVSIGVLSILGGNITPIVLHADHPSLTGFLLYLGMLEVVALVLTYLGRGGKWWILRMLSCALTAVWMAAIAGGLIFEHAPAATMLWFGVAYAVVYQAELIASSIRGGAVKRGGLDVTFSMLVTAALTIGGLWILRSEARIEQSVFVAVEAAGAVMLTMVLRRKSPGLAQAFAFQAAGLAALFVPVALSGEAILIGWGILALVMSAMGTRPGMIAAKALGPVVWLLAVADLAMRMQMGESDSIRNVWWTVAGTPLTAALVLGWGLALAGEAVGRMTRLRSGARSGMVTSISAAGVWVAMSMFELPPLGATLAILALAWVMCALNSVGLSVALMAVAAVKWAAVDGIAQRLSPGWSAMAHRPLVNSFVGMGALLACSFPALYVARRRAILAMTPKGDEGRVRFIVAQCAIVILTIAFSLQIDLIIQQASVFPWPAGQMENLGLTILWSAAVLAAWGAAIVTVGRAEAENARWLAAVLAGKFIVVDTMLFHGERVSAGYGFNLLMIAAIVVAGAVAVMSLPRLRAGAATLASVVLLWAGIFEIDRAANAGAIRSAWPPVQLTALLVTSLCAAWATGLFALVGRLREEEKTIRAYRAFAAGLLVVLSFGYLTIDTLLFRAIDGPVRAWAIANPQALAAAVVGAGLGLVWAGGMRVSHMCGFLMMLVALWAGTLEIDRLFTFWIAPGTLSNPELAANVAVSIFWGVFAVLCVMFGFQFRAAPMRYFGLGLFGITLVKIVFVDLGQIGTGYRVLSFMGLGAMLLGTSVLYGKLSPKSLAAK